MMKTSMSKYNPFVFLLVIVLSVSLAFLLSYTTTFQTLELKLLDLRFALRGPESLEDSPVVIVGIDDQSDESTPHRWPWPRSYFAHVIENLEEAGAAAIGVDVIFDQPDKYGPEQDDELTRVLSLYDNVVLVGKLLQTSQNYTYTTIIPPYEKFLSGNTSWGLVAIEADIDGFYRRYLIGQQYNDSLLPSFAAQMIRAKEGINKSNVLKTDNNFFYLSGYKIPKYDPNSFLINYKGPAFTFPYYSFDSILDDEDFDLRDEYDIDSFDDPGDPELGIPAGLKYSGKFKGKIVLIGSTMHELHDNFPTPFLEHYSAEGTQVKTEMPGVEIHANAILAILENNYLKIPSLSISLLIMFFLAVGVFFITRFVHTTWGLFVTIGITIGYVLISVFAFKQFNIFLQVVSPVLVILFCFVGNTVYQYLLSQREKRVLRGAFAHYVPEKVVQDIISNPDKLTLGGEERVVTVMFSDVVGFTTISEKLSPRQLVSLLNEYLTSMTDIVLKNDGIIDKYEGDAIMAEFGVPVFYEKHARAGCVAALEMQHKLEKLRADWKKENKPMLRARIGINTGEVIVGNMGSKNVFDYTVMGDHVNLGSRLEGANKFYGTEIMISEFTHDIIKNDFFTRPLDLIRVKGKQKPIEVFELIAERSASLNQSYLEMLELYHKGVIEYRKQNWKEAIDLFEYCLKLVPEDYPSQMYRKRCIDFKFTSPSPDWDGVTTMSEK